jgi:hypothetical protein
VNRPISPPGDVIYRHAGGAHLTSRRSPQYGPALEIRARTVSFSKFRRDIAGRL